MVIGSRIPKSLGGSRCSTYIEYSRFGAPEGGLAYKNPILTEIYSEISFEPGSIRGEDFFSVVPRFIEAGFAEVEFADAGVRLSIDPTSPDAVVPQPKTRVRCWTEGRTAMMQVAEDLIAVNLIGEYPGWDRFREHFQTLVQAGRDGMPNASRLSLGLTTIDRFTAPQDGFSLGEYLQTGGRYIPAWYEQAASNLDINLGLGFLERDGYNRKLNVRVRVEGEIVVVQLRASFQDTVGSKDLAVLLEGLHEESTATFEAIVTDRVREGIMGGVV